MMELDRRRWLNWSINHEGPELFLQQWLHRLPTDQLTHTHPAVLHQNSIGTTIGKIWSSTRSRERGIQSESARRIKYQIRTRWKGYWNPAHRTMPSRNLELPSVKGELARQYRNLGFVAAEQVPFFAYLDSELSTAGTMIHRPGSTSARKE